MRVEGGKEEGRKGIEGKMGREKGERRREKGERRKEKGERRREKGEGRKEKGERRREKEWNEENRERRRRQTEGGGKKEHAECAAGTQDMAVTGPGEGSRQRLSPQQEDTWQLAYNNYKKGDIEASFGIHQLERLKQVFLKTTRKKKQS
jgi:hypothetical protein